MNHERGFSRDSIGRRVLRIHIIYWVGRVKIAGDEPMRRVREQACSTFLTFVPRPLFLICSTVPRYHTVSTRYLPFSAQCVPAPGIGR
jgi:hypothetical protein